MGDSAPAQVRIVSVVGRVLRREGRIGGEVLDLRISSSGNTVVAETASHVVRIAWCAPIHAETEMRIWHEARRVGLPVPVPEGWGEVGGHAYMVYARLPGRPSPTEAAVVREAGEKLAALHGAGLDVFPRAIHARPRRLRRFASARTFVAQHEERLPPLVGACVRLAEHDWETAGHTPTHGDFRGSNLLARGGRLTGVIDWSDARRASREADLGSVDWARFRGVLDGYSTGARQLRGAELMGYFAARYAALAHAGIVGRAVALEAISRCAEALAARGITTEQGA